MEIRWFFQCVLILFSSSSLLHVSVGAPVGSKTYIIHTIKNNTHLDVMAKHAWYTELMAGAKQLLADDHPDDGMDTFHHVYHHVLNGFSARLTPQQAEFMANLPCVIAVYPDRLRQAHTTHTPEFLGLSDEDSELWRESKYGENVIIGVVDTGIWPERLSFSDRLLGPVPAWKGWKGECENGTLFTAAHCNNKIIGARYILKGFEADYGPINDSVTDLRSPRDIDGHGTHCASTAAGRWAYRASASGQAKGTARGMAPRARIAVYKVLWTNEHTSGAGADSDIIQAFDRAVEDGVDILSVSLGPEVNKEGITELWEDSTAIAAFNAAKKGVFVSVSGGNDGPSATLMDSFTIANVSPWMTTVAATTMDRDILSKVVLGDGTIVTGRSVYDGKALRGKAFPMIYGGDASISRNLVENASFCQPGALNESLVSGKILLCDFDAPKHKFPNPVPAGTVGVIFGNTAELRDALHIFAGELGGGVPMVNVGNQARERLMAYIRGVTETPPVASIHDATTVYDVTPAPQVSAFSSRGPINIPAHRETQWLKPDIAAPGQDILAAGVINQQFRYMSGTSMSCPHISGIAALLRSVHPNWSPAAIKSAMMTTATTVDNRNKTITALETGMAATPWAFGAGFVHPEKAMNPGLVYDMVSTDHLLFLCGLGYNYQKIRMFDMDAGFECPSNPPARIEDTNLPSYVAVFPVLPVGANATSISFNRTLTNVAKGGSTYTASVHMEQGAKFDVVVEPATLTFAGEGSTQKFILRVSPRAGAVFSDTETLWSEYYATISWSDGEHIVQSPVAIIVGI